MIKIIFTLFLISQSVFSKELTPDKNKFRFNNLYVFFTVTQDQFLINRSCIKGDCQAYLAFKNNGIINEKINLSFGKNPGSVWCSKKLKGTVLIGVNDFGDQQSFCQFQDNSFISTSAFKLPP
jgi:hypothetical protein